MRGHQMKPSKFYPSMFAQIVIEFKALRGNHASDKFKYLNIDTYVYGADTINRKLCCV